MSNRAIRRSGFTRADVEAAEKRGEQRGRSTMLSHLERVIAGEEPKVLTHQDVARMSADEVNSRWDAVCEVLAREEAEPEQAQPDEAA